jgi:hypothetical protein
VQIVLNQSAQSRVAFVDALAGGEEARARRPASDGGIKACERAPARQKAAREPA